LDEKGDGMTAAITRKTMAKRKRSRARARGLSSETVLLMAAIAGCFIYPLSHAMRDTGKRIADQSERGHEVMLEQAR
jgi:organic hydroperoxide reductase OsmC/OhrA